MGGGSNAIGIFHAFLPDSAVQLVGVEAGGRGDGIGEHAARFRGGAPGVLQGAYSYLLQDDDGQIVADAFGFGGPRLRHDRPRARLAARPEPRRIHRRLRCAKRWPRRACSRAPKASFRRSNRPTRWPRPSGARPRRQAQIFLVNVSGRGDKDIDIYRENFKELDPAMTRIGALFEDLKKTTARA